MHVGTQGILNNFGLVGMTKSHYAEITIIIRFYFHYKPT